MFALLGGFALCAKPCEFSLISLDRFTQFSNRFLLFFDGWAMADELLSLFDLRGQLLSNSVTFGLNLPKAIDVRRWRAVRMITEGW